MAKPNYQFEKRQRDLAKKARQEEKRQKKLRDSATDAAPNPVDTPPLPPSNGNKTTPDA